MESAKDFNNLMESKFEEIAKAEEEKERKRLEAHQQYANSCIGLLRDSIQLVSDERKYGYITKRDPIFGAYRVGTNDIPGHVPSEILLKDNRVTISLYFDEGVQVGKPDNFDIELVNSLLEPYFVRLSIDEDRNDNVSVVTIEYNRSLKITAEAQERMDEKQRRRLEEARKKRAAKEAEVAAMPKRQLNGDLSETDSFGFGFR